MPSWLDFNQIADWVSGAWWSYFVIFGVAPRSMRSSRSSRARRSVILGGQPRRAQAT